MPVHALDEVVRELQHLPSAPRVLPRLKQLLCDGNSAMEEVVQMVRLDPGIAARVLQFGNSAHYSQGLRCYSVEEAVNRVGYDQIYQLVSNAVASQVLVRPLATYGIEPDALWEHSLACALAAESLAVHTGFDRNVAYTIGLLHRIGMVAIDAWADHHRPDLRFDLGPLPLESCEAERATLGFHQAEAGAALLRSWEFPQSMYEPIRWQYLPNGTAMHFNLAALLHIAKWIRAAMLSPENAPPKPHSVLLTRLKISSNQLEKIAKEVRGKFERINVQLCEKEETIAVHFPGGSRQVSQKGSRPPV